MQNNKVSKNSTRDNSIMSEAEYVALVKSEADGLYYNCGGLCRSARENDCRFVWSRMDTPITLIVPKCGISSPLKDAMRQMLIVTSGPLPLGGYQIYINVFTGRDHALSGLKVHNGYSREDVIEKFNRWLASVQANPSNPLRAPLYKLVDECKWDELSAFLAIHYYGESIIRR